MNRNFDDAIVGFGGLTADSLDLAALELGMEAFSQEVEEEANEENK